MWWWWWHLYSEFITQSHTTDGAACLQCVYMTWRWRRVWSSVRALTLSAVIETSTSSSSQALSALLSASRVQLPLTAVSDNQPVNQPAAAARRLLGYLAPAVHVLLQRRSSVLTLRHISARILSHYRHVFNLFNRFLSLLDYSLVLLALRLHIS